MASFLSSLPAVKEFFPPTPRAYHLIQTVFKTFPIATIPTWFPDIGPSMGRTSSNSSSALNLSGRYAWAIAELVGPLNLIYILYSLPAKLHPLSSTTTTISPSTGLFGTGLPITHEIMGLLYVLHYLNRAIITPLFMAPSMSPIHVTTSFAMTFFQFLNSANLGAWISYDAQRRAISPNLTDEPKLFSLLAVVGIALFITGLAGNISAEWYLFELRRGAAKRKAKSEGKATITYDKVYVIPEAKALFKYVMYPHYSLEWVEWTGYWILAGAWDMGWGYGGFIYGVTPGASAAFIFLVNEVFAMMPRAVKGVPWYEKKFGKRALMGRKALIPGVL